MVYGFAGWLFGLRGFPWLFDFCLGWWLFACFVLLWVVLLLFVSVCCLNGVCFGIGSCVLCACILVAFGVGCGVCVCVLGLW